MNTQTSKPTPVINLTTGNLVMLDLPKLSIKEQDKVLFNEQIKLFVIQGADYDKIAKRVPCQVARPSQAMTFFAEYCKNMAKQGVKGYPAFSTYAYEMVYASLFNKKTMLEMVQQAVFLLKGWAEATPKQILNDAGLNHEGLSDDAIFSKAKNTLLNNPFITYYTDTTEYDHAAQQEITTILYSIK